MPNWRSSWNCRDTVHHHLIINWEAQYANRATVHVVVATLLIKKMMMMMMIYIILMIILIKITLIMIMIVIILILIISNI